MLKIIESKKTKEEYISIANLHNSIWPNKLVANDFKKSDQTQDPNLFFKRFIGKINDEIIAYAICKDPWNVSNQNYFFISITVNKNYRRQGIGSALYNKVMTCIQKLNPDTIMTETYENFNEAISFLKNRGFKQTIRLPRSLLYLDDFDINKWKHILIAMKTIGIEIISLKEYSKRTADWKKKVWKLHIECMKDVPSTVELTEMPFDQYDKTVLGKLDLSFWLIALDHENPVGMSILWRDDAEPHKMFTSLTGVTRAYRRKKIATAMKVINISQAKEISEISVIETENEENNPMFQLNLQLGFNSQAAKLGFEKKVK